MPDEDLPALKSDFLLEEIEYAYLAREETLWSKNIPEATTKVEMMLPFSL